jgi:hypothetical protein
MKPDPSTPPPSQSTGRPESLDEAIRRAQELVARYVPAGVSLADDLSADRRAEQDAE